MKADEQMMTIPMWRWHELTQPSVLERELRAEVDRLRAEAEALRAELQEANE